ncbi:O-antigen ligase family protein [Pseudarthrobacter sulfonivorans]|uniref:O-antigen ligase family protein n=1 Tax=Pseudarthrobacter sulfonivorans TaxID=121292 RepID=UPI00168B9D12|nr:O-antigen ligase family protein [Pseudarthrobacter sulfonivorans]
MRFSGEIPHSGLPIRAALYVLLGCIFVLMPGGLFRFAFPKIALLAAGIAVGLLVASRGRLAPSVRWSAVGVLAVFAVAAVMADGFGPAFWGRWPRYEGVPTVAAYLLLLGLGARFFGPGAGKSGRADWMRMLAGGMLLLAVLAVLEAFGVRVLGDTEEFRPGATLGNATDMGIVGLTGCAALLPRATWLGRRWDIVGAVSGGLVAVASGSRAVILVLGILVLAVVAWRAWQRRRTTGWRVAALWLLGGGASVALGVLAFPGVRERFFTVETVTGRADLWAATWALIQDNWLLGVGPGRFVDALPLFQSEAFAARVGTDYPADSPHMIPLQWLTDGGVLLLIVNVLLCAAVLRAGMRNIRACGTEQDRLFFVGAMAAVFSFGLVLLTHFPTPGTAVIPGLLAGALAGVAAASPAPAKSVKAVKAVNPTLEATTANPFAKAGTWSAAGAMALMTIAAGTASAAEIAMKRGQDAVVDGRLNEASEQFTAAANLRPWDGDVAMLAGQSFAGRAAAGDPRSGESAVQWSTRSLDSNPESVESLTSLAVGQLAAGNLEAAQQTLSTARGLAPVNSQVLLQSGLAEFWAGRHDIAIAYVTKAASLTPEPAEEQAILAKLREGTTAVNGENGVTVPGSNR